MKAVISNRKKCTPPDADPFSESIACKKLWQPPLLTEVDCEKTDSGLDALRDDGLKGIHESCHALHEAAFCP